MATNDSMGLRLMRRGALALLLAVGLTATAAAGGEREAPGAATGLLKVVAAEDFYGDIAAQIAGTHATVTSILRNPNIDPHEYEATVNDAKAVSGAALVVENGGGYDDWMDKLLSASPSRSRIVLKGFDLAPVRLADNPHVWYSPPDMEAVAKAIRDALGKLDPGDAAAFDANFTTFARSLGEIGKKMAAIKERYDGTPVGLTETIFQYQVPALGLTVLTPFAFQKAIAEGNDPPADSAVAAENQIRRRQVRVLIYNAQTANQVTARLRSEAAEAGIPVVAITETMPPELHYQIWMMSQLDRLEGALAAGGGRGGTASP